MRFSFRTDLSLGRYVELETPVHRLDPRTKLLLFAGTLAIALRADLKESLLLLAALAVAARLAKLSLSRASGMLRGMAWILGVTVAFQTFWVGPSQFGSIGKGFEVGVWMSLRLAAMVLAASLLTHTTEPLRLADALAKLFGFLERVKVPIRALAMVLTLAVRFLPTILEESSRIVTAQRARGARFEGGLLKRARRLLPLVVPLLSGCFRRADRLALAMEARHYRVDAPRTSLEPLAFARSDAFALAGLVLLLLVSFGVFPGV